MSVVLLYHRVAATAVDPFQLAVHPDRFAAHIEHLLRLGSTVPLGDVVGRGSSRRIAITFDDGYADNATTAAPQLAGNGLPATWFITTSTLGRRRFWWDRLTEALRGDHPRPDHLDIDIGGRELWLDLRKPADRHTALLFLHKRLLPLPPEELSATVDHIVELLGSAPTTDDGLTMTVEQLRALAELPEQHVGAHTQTHAHLSSQSPERQQAEIEGSVQDLERLLGMPVHDFAYPFGGPGAIGAIAPQMVERSGFRIACTTTPARVTPRSTPYLLPRLTVLDWDADEFAARLGALLR